MAGKAAAMDTIASPCINVCRLDPKGEWCTGCGRTLAEIGDWPTATTAQRQAILERAARRRDASPPAA